MTIYSLNPSSSYYLNIITNNNRVSIFSNDKKDIFEFAKTNNVTKSMKINYIKKTRSENIDDIIDYGIRLSKSEEIQLDIF